MRKENIIGVSLYLASPILLLVNEITKFMQGADLLDLFTFSTILVVLAGMGLTLVSLDINRLIIILSWVFLIVPLVLTLIFGSQSDLLTSITVSVLIWSAIALYKGGWDKNKEIVVILISTVLIWVITTNLTAFNII